MQLQAPQVWGLISRPVLVYAARMMLGHLIGGFIVFMLLLHVLPLPAGVPPFEMDRANSIAFLFFLPFALIMLVGGGVLAALPVLKWTARGGDPSPRERRAALMQPLRQLGVQLATWLTGLIMFTSLNIHLGGGMALRIAITTIMGGATACGIAYVMGERELRGLVSRALRSGSGGEWHTAGITPRVLIIWFLSSGVPAVGIAITAAPQLIGGNTDLTGAIGPSAFFLALITLVVGLTGMVYVVRTIADPVRQVSEAMQRVEEGRTDVRVWVYDGSEIGQLQAGFNRMVAGVEERELVRDLLNKHVGENVARQAVERGTTLGGETLNIAVLFTDIIGSTGLAERLPPDQVVEMLNEFFRVVVATVDKHGGFINKFEGDAALAVFGAPTSIEDPAGAALRAARELREEIVKLGLTDAGIGVSAGPAVAGYIGASDRFEYTVIGDPVNEAARLTDLAKRRSSRVLASQRTIDAAHPEEAEHWKLMERVSLRGRKARTRIAAPRHSTRQRGFAIAAGEYSQSG